MEQDTKELKKNWKFFLFYGLAILVISTIVQFELNQWLNSRAQGPPCRVDFPVDEFTFNKLSEYFRIEYLLINLRDKDLQIEGIDAYCYWKTEKETEKSDGSGDVIIQPPLIEQISTPKELDKINALSSEVKSSNCRSPDKEGLYKISVLVRTTQGNCQSEVLMEVKNESK